MTVRAIGASGKLTTVLHLGRAFSRSLDCGNFANRILRGLPRFDHDVIRSDLRASSGVADACTKSDDRHHGNERDQRDLELSQSIRFQKRIVHRRFLTLTVPPRPAAYDISTAKRDAPGSRPTDFQRSHRVCDAVR